MQVEPFEPFLSAEFLRDVLQNFVPYVSSRQAFYDLLPHLPYTQLPGKKRKLYQLGRVLSFLRNFEVEPACLMESPLHRRRPRRKTA